MMTDGRNNNPYDLKFGIDLGPRVEAVIETQKVEILKFFAFKHLQNQRLQEISKEFAVLALFLTETLPNGPERAVSLRKLLEAKDAAVRAAL